MVDWNGKYEITWSETFGVYFEEKLKNILLLLVCTLKDAAKEWGSAVRRGAKTNVEFRFCWEEEREKRWKMAWVTLLLLPDPSFSWFEESSINQASNLQENTQTRQKTGRRRRGRFRAFNVPKMLLYKNMKFIFGKSRFKILHSTHAASWQEMSLFSKGSLSSVDSKCNWWENVSRFKWTAHEKLIVTFVNVAVEK